MLWHQTGNSQGNYRFDARFYVKTSYKTHFHRNYELIYAVAGQCRVQVNGQDITITEGQYLLIPPYAIHAFTMDEGSKLWVCVFSADHIGGLTSSTLHAPFKCEEDVQQFLNTRLIFSPAPDRLIAQACLYLVYHASRQAEVLATMDFDRVVQISNVISENLSRDITMAETANLLGFEYHYFSRLFHQLFNMNFRQYLNLYRIELACTLLRTTQKDISDIALECGFQTLRSFNRAFKVATAQTPSQYRYAADFR